MSIWALHVVGVCYLLTAIDMFTSHKFGMAMAFLCYAIANYGLLWASRS